MTDLDDTDLVLASRRGDLEAFSVLVTRHQKAVRACLAVRLEDAHEAEDLAQETFVTAYRKLADFDASRPLRPWLRGIALNLLCNHARKHRPVAVGSVAELQVLAERELEAHHTGSEEGDRLTALQGCLKRLDAFSQDLIRARYHDGTGIAALCIQFRKRHSAITMQLYRARLQLRQCIRQILGLV